MNPAPSEVWLLHGWAANRHVFDDLRTRLPESLHVHARDLPGHGSAAFAGEFDIATIAAGYAAQIDSQAHILGWSLGGLIGLYLAAHYPDKVASLCLTAAFAKFVASDDYPEGLRQPALAKMVTLFQADYPKYMRQFLQLQFLYAKDAAAILSDIVPKIVAHGAPAALQAALDAVAQTDARPWLAAVRCPTLLIFGQKDSITPPRMGEYLHRHLPNSRLLLFERDSHAPFLSHPQHFVEQLLSFWSHP